MTTEVKEKNITYRWAINHAVAEEMRRDPKVIFYGEDVAQHGGNFAVSRGLFEEFGAERVFDTPISETGIIGTAIGAAMTGLRPVVELMFAGFIGTCFDQIFYKLSDWKDWNNLQMLPVVVRLPMGGGAGHEHSHCPEALLIHSPGLKVVCPSTAYDAKGLLKTAIRDDDPVVFLEHINLYAMKGPIPADEEILIPFGQAKIRREGKNVTIISYASMVYKALAAAEKLAQEGIEAEVIDLRTLVPLDEEAILKSVEKTGKVVIAHEAMERGGAGGWLASIIADKGFDYLDAPIKVVAGRNVILLGGPVDPISTPQAPDIIEAVKALF